MKAVLFDLDDTLYPERSFVRSGFRAVARHLARTAPLDAESLFQRMMVVLEREGRGEVFDIVLQDLGHYRLNLVPELVHVYRTHRPAIRLFDDVEPGLRRLKQEGFLLGVVTDGLASVQRNKIGALDLETMVDTIVCTEEVGRGEGKPSAAPFRTALELLQVEPSETAYVGDDPAKDFQGPRELGMRTVHMHRKGLSGRLAQEEIGKVDLRVETLEELVTKLGT